MPRSGREWSNYPLDCSNLTAVAYRLARKVAPKAWPQLDDFSVAQHDATSKRSLGRDMASGSLRIGDLGFLHNPSGTVHHVGLYVGRGWVIEAKGRAYGVVKTSLRAFNSRGADWHRGRRD
jgi:cell wall-associated NlpC family hydrolase